MKTITQIEIADIIPGSNDRTTFDDNSISELAQSIKEHGLIQPITVTAIDEPASDPIYMIVAGERRFRACKFLGMDTIPAIVEDFTQEQASAVMLAENISRKDLDPIDEANAYQARINQFGWAPDDIASKAGVTVIRVQARLKLLVLRDDVKQLVRTGNLQIGYANILATSGLDANFQTLAIRELREHNSPTPTWFRRICGILINKQAQTRLFDDPLFSGHPIEMATVTNDAEPPHPSTTKPPKSGNTHKQVIENQVTFWKDAATSWDQLGKPFKRQECQSAAQALQSVLFAI